jgi:non-heme chloroperoxidase
MPYTKSEVSLYYEVAGSGRPVVLVHGWPLSSRMWEYTIPDLIDAGFQCITYDRRGFGDSNRPWDGYDYDTLADDLDSLLTELDLHDVALIGFSMGGGEVARYLSTRGDARVSKAVLLSAVTPHLYQSEESPDGLEPATLESFDAAMAEDRIEFLKTFGKMFFGISAGHKVTEMLTGEERKVPSDSLMDYFLQIESFASPRATRQCAAAFGQTDFTADLQKINVPTLVIHGDSDHTVPFEATGKRAAELIEGSRLEVIEGAPHGLWYTHKREVNRLLFQFLSQHTTATSGGLS